MKIDPAIFKAYDIRGIYPEQVNEEMAYKLGRAFVDFLNAEKVVIGRDARLSSPDLANSLIKGITDQGAKVIDIGLATSPMMYFAVAKYNFDGGIIITASHNPKEYNGFKLVKKEAAPIGQDSGLPEIKKMVLENKFTLVSKKGQISKKDVLDSYVNDIFKRVQSEKIGNFKIIADAGNGMAGLVFPEFFAKLNCQVTQLYWQLDGAFPNHLANPLITSTLNDLRERLIKEKADLGIAADGDADRIFFIDEKGEIIRADLITALMAKVFLSENPGQKILYDVRASRIVKETIKANSGQPVICRVGHSFFKQKMRQEKALFAGETSGHYYLKNDCYRESPFIIILLLLKLLTEQKKTISEIVKPFKKYFSPGQINFEAEDEETVLAQVEKYYHQGQISHLDGISIEFDDWWFNLRPSNTEPLLRLNIEAKTEKLLKEKLKEITQIINEKSCRLR